MNINEMTLQELRDYKETLVQTGQSQDEINRISNRIAELELVEQSKAEELQVVTAEAVKFMDSLDFGGDDPKDLFINYTDDKAKTSYNYVNAVIQNAVVEMKKVDLLRIKELESANASLQDKYSQSEEANEALKHIVDTAKLDITDANSKRDAAAKALDEANEEIARLNGHLNDLRQQIAIGAANAAKVVEVDVMSAREKLMEERRKEEEAKPVIYNIRWDETTKTPGTHYLAELAQTDETITFPYLAMRGDIAYPTEMKGKYRVVTKEGAVPFRTAHLEEQERDNADHTHDISAGDNGITSSPQFQGEYSTTGGLDQAYASGTVAGSTVTREEFEALKSTVKRLENEVYAVREVV